MYEFSLTLHFVAFALQVQDFLRQVTRGLGRLRELDIVHRDLRPSNILVDPGPIFKVCQKALSKSMKMYLIKSFVQSINADNWKNLFFSADIRCAIRNCTVRFQGSLLNSCHGSEQLK